MSKMIKNSSVSFKQIKADIETWLSTLDNWQDIKDNLPASNLTLITELLAGFGTYIIYKNHALRDETYLTTAKLDRSVYSIARTFGYDIKRYTAPSLKLKYMAVPTKKLQTGDVLGTYGNYSIVYFGPDIVLEKLDTVDVFIGSVFEEELDVVYESDLLRYNISPKSLTSVDDTHIRIFGDDVELTISRDIEDYVIRGNVVDFSNDPFNTDLIVADRKNNYGVVLDEAVKVRIQHLETDGEMDSIDLTKVELNEDYVSLSINHLGTNGQTVDHIRRLVPLFYSTQRRMVTRRDHQYVAEAHNYIKSAYAEKEQGIFGELKLSFDTPDVSGSKYEIKILTRSYDYTTSSSDMTALAKNIYDLIKGDGAFKATLNADNTITLDARESGLVDYVTLSSNIHREDISVGKAGKCCTVNLYYIKYNVVDEPIPLTIFEQIEFADYLEYYKMVGVRIILIPAESINKSIKLKIRLSDNQYKDAVYADINRIIKEYCLTLDTAFDYGELMTKISKIYYLDENNEMIRPVVAVLPNQEIFNLDAEVDKYINFNEIDLSEF